MVKLLQISVQIITIICRLSTEFREIPEFKSFHPDHKKLANPYFTRTCGFFLIIRSYILSFAVLSYSLRS